MIIPIRSNFTGRNRVQTKISGETRTKGSFAAECDVNNIMKKYLRTGNLPNTNPIPPQYADVSELVDYRAALDLVQAANDSFNSLPSKVRARFGNDPHQMIEFLSDVTNDDEAVRLGLKVRVQIPDSSASAPNKARVEPSGSAGQPEVVEGPKA